MSSCFWCAYVQTYVCLLHSLIQSNSAICMTLWFMWRRDFLLHRTYSRKLWRFLFHVFDWLYFICCLVYFFSIDQFRSLCTSFDAKSSRMYEVLLVNPFADVFFFGDCNNLHHKYWLTFSGWTGRLGELWNFSILNKLTQMVHFLLWFLTVTLTVLLFLTLLFVLQVVFPPSGNSNHVVVSVSSDFPSNSGRDASFHCTAYDYFYADWGGLHDHLRETKW